MRRAVLMLVLCACFLYAEDEQASARKIVVKVQPQYPALAHAAHITGTAKLLVRVNSNGKVESVEVLGGHPLLAQAAVAAVSQWKWEPSSQSSQEAVLVKFSLSDRPE